MDRRVSKKKKIPEIRFELIARRIFSQIKQLPEFINFWTYTWRLKKKEINKTVWMIEHIESRAHTIKMIKTKKQLKDLRKTNTSAI